MSNEIDYYTYAVKVKSGEYPYSEFLAILYTPEVTLPGQDEIEELMSGGKLMSILRIGTFRHPKLPGGSKMPPIECINTRVPYANKLLITHAWWHTTRRY